MAHVLCYNHLHLIFYDTLYMKSCGLVVYEEILSPILFTIAIYYSA